MRIMEEHVAGADADTAAMAAAAAAATGPSSTSSSSSASDHPAAIAYSSPSASASSGAIIASGLVQRLAGLPQMMSAAVALMLAVVRKALQGGPHTTNIWAEASPRCGLPSAQHAGTQA